MVAYFDVYQDSKGEYRWRFVAANGRIVAVSSEGYSSKWGATNSIDIMKGEGPGAPVV